MRIFAIILLIIFGTMEWLAFLLATDPVTINLYSIKTTIYTAALLVVMALYREKAS